MDDIREILELYRGGRISLKEAEKRICSSSMLELECACIDINREIRTGIPEFILAEGKTIEHIERIAKSVVERKGWAIFTRISRDAVDILKRKIKTKFRYYPDAHLCAIGKIPEEKVDGTVGIITAGTADIPVAEEARIVCELMGCKTTKAYDVGVAGIHRLFKPLKDMVRNVDVYIVAAGREGALPGVVAGLVDAPVIGLPVSIGYGYHGKGEAALATMLQSCSPVLVVNIDAGFVAGVMAAQICRSVSNARKKA